MKIITDEKLLRRKSTEASGDYQNIVDDLLEAAEEARYSKMGCAGLAANQIGHLVRIFVMNIDNWFEAFINPNVIKKGGRMIRGKESCLSRPDKPPIEKMRFQRITIEYTDTDGNIKKETFHNFNARVVQHEMDHFDGKLI